jgi:hypothetical protein
MSPRIAVRLLLSALALSAAVAARAPAQEQQRAPEKSHPKVKLDRFDLKKVRRPSAEVSSPGGLIRPREVQAPVPGPAPPGSKPMAIPSAPRMVGAPLAPNAAPRTPRRVDFPELKANFLGVRSNQQWYPADTFGAVGPNHLLVALNTEVSAQTRSGQSLWRYDLDAFFGSPNPFEFHITFDPRIVYDRFADRWVLVVAADKNRVTSSVIVAASPTGDPTAEAEWYRMTVQADPDQATWLDYPCVAITRDWIVITGNHFNIDPGKAWEFQYASILLIKKAALYAGQNREPRLVQVRDKTAFTLVPATVLDDEGPGPAIVLAQHYDGDDKGKGALRVWRMDDPETSTEAYPVDSATVPRPSGPDRWYDNRVPIVYAPQLNTPTGIAVDDARVQSAVWANGSLWCAHTIFLPADNPSRCAVQWWELGPQGQVRQRGLIDDPHGLVFRAFPSLAVNRRGDMLIGFSRFSATGFASAAYAYRLNGDPRNSVRPDRVYKPGVDRYVVGPPDSNRWGDYSSTIVDPVNRLDFWTIQKYAEQNVAKVGAWGTWWAKISP